MKEDIKTDQEAWNKELEDAGLPEELPPLQPVASEQERKALQELAEVTEYLSELGLLPRDLQNGILTDLKAQRKAGVPPDKILERFKTLVVKTQELDQMTADDSDKKHEPKKPKDVKEAEREAEEKVEELIEEIEKIIEKSKKKQKYVN